MRIPSISLSCLSLVLSSLALHAQKPKEADPAKAEVPLDCAKDWSAFLAYDSGGFGIWDVRCRQLQPRFACPEIIAFDDLGRATVLRSYSGKWTPMQTMQDGRWLAPNCWGEFDASREGPEMYTGGQRGHLYQIWPRPDGGFDSRLVARFPGAEIHTLLMGDLDTARSGKELLVFLLDGRVRLVTRDEGSAKETIERLPQLPGRIRDAVLLPGSKSKSPWFATASRCGEITLYRLRGKVLDRHRILHQDMGFGRVCLGANTKSPVLYVTRDDGLVLRLEPKTPGEVEGSWNCEKVYAGPQGLRGIISGKFDDNPQTETLAVFGYSKKVQLLARRGTGPWTVETIFVAKDKGHWLTKGEVDGRNGTEELIASGYSGRVILLARKPGYALKRVAVDPDSEKSSAESCDCKTCRAKRAAAGKD